jgi:DNA repair exonuclease SbcCD ATPase subunit
MARRETGSSPLHRGDLPMSEATLQELYAAASRLTRERDEARAERDAFSAAAEKLVAHVEELRAKFERVELLLDRRAKERDEARAVARLAIVAWHARQDALSLPGCGHDEQEIRELYAEHPWLKESDG